MIAKFLAGSALILFASMLRAEEPSQGQPKPPDQKVADGTPKNDDQAAKDKEEAVKQAACNDLREAWLKRRRREEEERKRIEKKREEEECCPRKPDVVRSDNPRQIENTTDRP